MENNECHNTPKQQSPIISELTKHLIDIISDEVMSEEHQKKIKRNIVIPVINMIYYQLYPYIIAIVFCILFIVILSLLTFCMFIFYLIIPRNNIQN